MSYGTYKHKPNTKEQNKKISVAMKGKKGLGRKKGFEHTEEEKKKISIGIKNAYKNNPKLGFQKGQDGYNWQGGKSFEPYTIDWTETLRRSIRERDNYICQICSQYASTIHHIDYDKTNCNPENLITLCKKCHSKTNFNRKNWMNYFNNKKGRLIAVRGRGVIRS